MHQFSFGQFAAAELSAPATKACSGARQALVLARCQQGASSSAGARARCSALYRLPSGDSTMIYRRVSGVQTWSLAGTQAFAARDAAATQSGTLLVTTPDGVFSSEENGMFWSNSSSGIQGVGSSVQPFNRLQRLLLLAPVAGSIAQSMAESVGHEAGCSHQLPRRWTSRLQYQQLSSAQQVAFGVHSMEGEFPAVLNATDAIVEPVIEHRTASRNAPCSWLDLSVHFLQRNGMDEAFSAGRAGPPPPLG